MENRTNFPTYCYKIEFKKRRAQEIIITTKSGKLADEIQNYFKVKSLLQLEELKNNTIKL